MCIPGDSLSIVDGMVYIDGKQLALPEQAKPQFSYNVVVDGKRLLILNFWLKTWISPMLQDIRSKRHSNI
jgi:signal peptidase I